MGGTARTDVNAPRGSRRRTASVLSVSGEVARYAIPLTLIYCSGSAASPLWILSSMNAFVWRPRTPARAKIDLAILVGMHVVLLLAFWAEHHAGDSWMTLLVLLASLVAHTTTGRAVDRNEDVRAERAAIETELAAQRLERDRERMARELHDGVGADVTALVLRLRRAAQSQTSPKAPELAERAQRLLDELRSVVWSLRNEQGTLAELGKLIDATCRGSRGSVAYERTTPVAVAKTPVGPRAALAALEAARALVREGAERSGVQKLTLSLDVTTAEHLLDRLTLALDDDAGGERLVASIALDDARIPG